MRSNGRSPFWRAAAALIVTGLSCPVSALAANPRTIDPAVFDEAIRTRMGNSVMGYAFVVADRNGIAAKASDGFAQAPGDGNLRMKTFIPANIGSIAKVMTGVALLDMLEQHMVTPLPVSSQLNTPMVFFTPDKWRSVYAENDPDLRRITLRHLLSHQSGLPGTNSGGNHGTKVAQALALGATASAIGSGTFAYSGGRGNTNYTISMYVIAALAFPDEVDRFERDNEHTGLAEYNARAANTYGALYERYIRERFLPKTLTRISPTCRPGADIPNGRFAKEYASKSDQRGEAIDSSFCRSQGSWFFSAQELAEFARTLEFSNRYIDSSTRAMLFDDTIVNQPLNKGMVYNRAIGPGNFAAEIAARWLPGHGGATAIGHRAILMRLPFDHVGVGVATSPEMGGGQLAVVLRDAFFDATREWDEWNSDRPGGDLRDFDLSTPDPVLCRSACDGDSRCAAWTYVKPGRQGPQARCWLKSMAPAGVSNDCCASGVKGVDYDTDRPGGDLRRVSLGRSDAALCQALCGLDGKCRAWTMVRAGVQEAKAQCWLKDRVPPSRSNGCCASGRK